MRGDDEPDLVDIRIFDHEVCNDQVSLVDRVEGSEKKSCFICRSFIHSVVHESQKIRSLVFQLYMQKNISGDEFLNQTDSITARFVEDVINNDVVKIISKFHFHESFSGSFLQTFFGFGTPVS